MARSLGHFIATKLKNTPLTPIHATTMFLITGFIAIGSLLKGYLIASAFLLLLKSILDAADGELARLKKTILCWPLLRFNIRSNT